MILVHLVYLTVLDVLWYSNDLRVTNLRCKSWLILYHLSQINDACKLSVCGKLKNTHTFLGHKKHSCLNLVIFDFRAFWCCCNSLINASSVFPAVISLSSGAVCPLPVLAHVLVPLLLPSSLRGALLCNARCIRCIFIPHYFSPHRPLLERGDAAIWKKGLTLCCELRCLIFCLDMLW